MIELMHGFRARLALLSNVKPQCGWPCETETARNSILGWTGFGNGAANPMISQAPNQVGLGGGCALLQDPNQAYVWSSQMAPLLKRQMHHYRSGLDPIPLGRFGDHPVVGVCALQDNGLNHCRALDVPLYENLYTAPTGRYRFPSDVSLFDASLTGGCPAYSLPGIGKYPG